MIFFLEPTSQKFESAVCFDVLSSIPPENEKDFILNISKSLTDQGCLVIGSQINWLQGFQTKRI